jgi:molecular chaperone GrpE
MVVMAENENKEEILEEVLEELEEEAKNSSEAEDAEADTEPAADAGDADEADADTDESSSEEASDADSIDADKTEDDKVEKKGFFKKKKDKKDEQIEDLNDKLKRQMAEFENFRKRTEKEKTQMYDMGARSIIEKILPVIDNFERGFAAVSEEDKDDAFVTGMDKVYKQMMTELDAIGVKPIEAVGKEFNPDYHNAVMQVASEEYESGIVAQELQKGYTYKDYVVRHSMVAVVE